MRPIDGAFDYRRLADVHRPSCNDALTADVRRLARSGLTARDIPAALRVNLAQVLELLNQQQSPADQMPR